jgi:hypothetical protein
MPLRVEPSTERLEELELAKEACAVTSRVVVSAPEPRVTSMATDAHW